MNSININSHPLIDRHKVPKKREVAKDYNNNNNNNNKSNKKKTHNTEVLEKSIKIILFAKLYQINV